MSSSQITVEVPSAPCTLEKDIAYWYALHTRARHEKAVSERLEEEGITTFLPLVGEVHRWRDPKKPYNCYCSAAASL